MYIPINELNKYFSNIAKIDNKEFNSKEEMESHFKNKNVDFKDYKKKISNWASTSLSIESEFVKELEQILKKIEFDNL
ncbi:hypothetical protein [Spiroplasma endosymbiont of Cantharis rufa]|uniref:hypothetical protein n=1 Tax=Spiroplasma endosymbiont of Cantharis rufa TaxID=3066279 RepID=UPI0030CCB386